MDNSDYPSTRIAPVDDAPDAHLPGDGNSSEGQEKLLRDLLDALSVRLKETPSARVEEFLEAHAEIRNNPEAVVRLIYEEVCLREERGEKVSAQSVFARFPQYRKQLELVLDCHSLLKEPPKDLFTQAAECVGDFEVLAELGRGSMGSVFLATQKSLAHRPMVLKVSQKQADEHLSLARLQHTNIVPLYAVHEDMTASLRILCMPYFGGATVRDVIDAVDKIPLPHRRGMDIVAAIDASQSRLPLTLPRRGDARSLLERVSYVQAICWLGATLAESLQYAHDRGLVHLDVKPSNVLLAVDGQPMLLDFHLAQAPLTPEGPLPTHVGGTPGYMSPEQQEVFARARPERRICATVDGRSDVYALGLLLCEALGGRRPHHMLPLQDWSTRIQEDNANNVSILLNHAPAARIPDPQHTCDEITPGLRAILHRCLDPNQDTRYPSAAALAEDLRRHLENRPLKYVREPRRERWRKWRQRSPQALSVAVMKGAVFAATAALLLFLWDRGNEQQRQTQLAVAEARSLLDQGEYAQAQKALQRGLLAAQSRTVTGNSEEMGELHNLSRLAHRGSAAANLHVLADKFRFLYGQGLDALPDKHKLAEQGLAVWEKRDALLDQKWGTLPKNDEDRLRRDLLDLGIIWADLQARLTAGAADDMHRESLRMLVEVEAQFGPNPVLLHQQMAHARALGDIETANAAAHKAAQLRAQTSWQCYALGRWLIHANRAEEAIPLLEQSLDLDPGGFWPNFYLGIGYYRLERFDLAAEVFRVCTSIRPQDASCSFNWGQAEAARGNLERALRQYDRALQLQPELVQARLNRGLLHLRQKQYAQAAADLDRALSEGTNSVVAHYNLALTHKAMGNAREALQHVNLVLQLDPAHGEARRLKAHLERAQ